MREPDSPTESQLRHLLAHATAAAVEHGANPTRRSYGLMVRSRAIFYGTMLMALRGRSGILPESPGASSTLVDNGNRREAAV